MNRENATTNASEIAEIKATIQNLRRLIRASMEAGRIEEANARIAAVKKWERELAWKSGSRRASWDI